MNENKKICFVVMGFGKKTDYESGRTLDLDATYEAIIKPAVEGAGLRCVRADEIMHSGVIDTKMYEMLLKADLVVADISTGNVNAVYELGVRHALRPNSTIIMKESKGRLYFDLDHVATFKYDHLGEDIGAREAKRAKDALEMLIGAAANSSAPDSPVYTYLPNLKMPQMTDAEIDAIIDQAESVQEDFSRHIQDGESALSNSDFSSAIAAFQSAEKIKPQDPFILQRLALSTYKSRSPSTIDALIRGLMIIEILTPASSNDPETLGIAGAIRKRLWQETGDLAQLDSAIRFYERGFKVRQDYYNGENLAVCLDFRASTQQELGEKFYDVISANKIREEIVASLLIEIEASDFNDRADGKWIFATLANCYFALKKNDDGDVFEEKFRRCNPAEWELETFERGKSAALARESIGTNEMVRRSCD